MSFVASVEPYYHHQNSENFSEFCCTPSDDGDGTTLWRGRRSTDKFGASDNVGASNATDIGATKSGGGTATSNGGRASRGGRDTAGASTVAANASTRVEAVGKTATAGGSVLGVLFTAVDNNRQWPSAAIWTSDGGTTTSGGAATASTTSGIGGGSGDRRRRAVGPCGHAVCRQVRANPFCCRTQPSLSSLCECLSFRLPSPSCSCPHAAGTRGWRCLRHRDCLYGGSRAPVRQGGVPGAVNVDKAGPDGGLDARRRCR